MCIEIKAKVSFAHPLARIHILLMFTVIVVSGETGRCEKAAYEPLAIEPSQQTIHPFNGKDLSGFTKWLQTTKHDDPQSDYRVADGMIHIGGRGMGYLATVNSYKNYHLSVEYKWGKRTDGSKYVRNSGILLHATGPDGNARGIWMASIECQLAQGCEGDLIVIRGKHKKGNVIPVTISSDTRTADDGRTRWLRGGRKTVYSGKQFWWSNHEVGFQELLDTRGKEDAASPLGEWTQVECICAGRRITIKINGKTVNECYDVFPTAGTCGEFSECARIRDPGVGPSNVWVCKRCWKAEMQQRRNFNVRQRLSQGNPDHLVPRPWPKKRRVIETRLVVP